jgi:hypothetical protein
VILTDLVNGQDIWVIEPNDSVRFLLKPLQALGISRKAQGQELKRGFSAGDNIDGQIDFAHPAGAYRFGNFVVIDGLADERISFLVLNNLRCETDS